MIDDDSKQSQHGRGADQEARRQPGGAGKDARQAAQQPGPATRSGQAEGQQSRKQEPEHASHKARIQPAPRPSTSSEAGGEERQTGGSTSGRSGQGRVGNEGDNDPP
jgi:hypothetical protein